MTALELRSAPKPAHQPALQTAHQPDRGSAPRPARRFARATALLGAALVALGASLSVAAPALAHDELVGYDVVTSSSDGSVTGIALHFSNEIMDIGTEIIATDHHGAEVQSGAPEISGRDVTQALTAPLAEGEYGIAWRVVSSDGHPIQGALNLSVRADGSGELAVAPADGEAGSDETDSDADGEHADHEHADDEPEMTTQVTATPISAETGAQPVWLWVIIGVVGAGVVAAIVAGTVVGQKRRREAFDAAAQNGAAPEDGNDAWLGDHVGR